MAGNNVVAPARGTVLATDNIDEIHYPIDKIAFGAEDEVTLVSPADPLPVGDAATLAKLTSILAKLITSPATEATLASCLTQLQAIATAGSGSGSATAAGQASALTVLNAIATAVQGTLAISAGSLPLPSGAATQTTLASVLAKLTSDPSTAAKQTEISGKLDTLATQVTAAAILAKLSADPATQTTLAAVLTKLSADPATQTTLAAVLAKLSADPATQTTLAAVLSAVTGTLNIAGPASTVATATFTRPANPTAYSSGQLIANSTTAGSVQPMQFTVARANGGTGAIVRNRVSTSKTGLAGTEAVRLHLFKTSPTVANGDGGTFSVNGVAAIHLGYFDTTLDRVFSDGSKGIGIPAVGPSVIFDAAGGSQLIYGLLEARGTFTLDSGGTLVSALEVLRD